jgi:hypothetical protein
MKNTNIPAPAPGGLLRVGVHSINLAFVSHVTFSGEVIVHFNSGLTIRFPYRVEGLSDLLKLYGLPALGGLKDAPAPPFSADLGA